jgi:hypothetical protein
MVYSIITHEVQQLRHRSFAKAGSLDDLVKYFKKEEWRDEIQ